MRSRKFDQPQALIHADLPTGTVLISMRQIATAFAEAGARVWICDADEAALDAYRQLKPEARSKHLAGQAIAINGNMGGED